MNTSGAETIIAIDINPEKFTIGKEFGATHCLNPNDLPGLSNFDLISELI